MGNNKQRAIEQSSAEQIARQGIQQSSNQAMRNFACKGKGPGSRCKGSKCTSKFNNYGHLNRRLPDSAYRLRSTSVNLTPKASVQKTRTWDRREKEEIRRRTHLRVPTPKSTHPILRFLFHTYYPTVLMRKTYAEPDKLLLLQYLYLYLCDTCAPLSAPCCNHRNVGTKKGSGYTCNEETSGKINGGQWFQLLYTAEEMITKCENRAFRQPSPLASSLVNHPLYTPMHNDKGTMIEEQDQRWYANSEFNLISKGFCLQFGTEGRTGVCFGRIYADIAYPCDGSCLCFDFT